MKLQVLRRGFHKTAMNFILVTGVKLPHQGQRRNDYTSNRFEKLDMAAAKDDEEISPTLRAKPKGVERGARLASDRKPWHKTIPYLARWN